MILIINKNGEITQKNVKSYDNLYSVCNYRNNNNFEVLHVWNNEIYLYGKKTGRSGYENSYAFPLPINNEQYYGTLCIVKQIRGEYVPITLTEWTRIYNKMMGINESTEENVVIEPSNNTIYNKIYSPDTELMHEEYETEDEDEN
jgi:hypothetical protein